MGGTPAYVFVVRHGNRLDAADKRWHLSSPTPYDPPLTYGGFLQSRLVGNQIASILEQAKIEQEASNNGSKKRIRFKVVIHSSPFLRCVQTSVGISSGLAQTPPESPYHPSDVFVSATGSTAKSEFKPAILRLDPFLGEWLCPEYFEMITPPPGAALMVGSAKADLLRREDYSALTQTTTVTRDHRSSSGSLWNGSPSASPAMTAVPGPPLPASDKDTSSLTSVPTSSMAAALSGQLGNQHDQKKGYIFPKQNYAISNSGRIPEGFVAHARDHCVVVDYQWDSMRAPLDFGNGGQFGEEWTAMHMRFRKGFKKLVHWYSTTESPTEMVTKGVQNGDGNSDDSEDEEVQTVVILVSHGAGCNALIGAITHQPVLMDVGIASITMAVRKPDVTYDDLLATSLARDPSAEPYVSPHEIFDIRLSATTDHLRSTASTPVSARSTSTSGDMFPVGASRGRAPSIGTSVGPLIGSFVYSSDPLLANGSRSTSANAVLGSSIRRDSTSQRPTPRTSNLATSTLAKTTTAPRSKSPVASSSSFGLWSPAPSSLRLMDDGGDDESNEEKEDFDALLPNFGQARFKPETQENKPQDRVTTPPLLSDELDIKAPEFPMPQSISAPTLSSNLPPSPVSTFGSFSYSSMGGDSSFKSKPRGPVLSAPIKIKTHLDFEKPAEEISIAQLDGLGGTWGLPMPPGEAERLRDMSFSKRRWTTTERA